MTEQYTDTEFIDVDLVVRSQFNQSLMDGDIMDDFIGLVAMAAPLLVIAFWVLVSLVLAVMVGWKVIKKKLYLKIVGGGVVFCFALAFPFSDQIVGRIYLNHLCETEAGVKVYQTIELPAEYWDEDGKPTFYKGSSNNDVPSYAFDRVGIAVTIERNDQQRFFKIKQFESTTSLTKTGQRLNKITAFQYRGGWVAREFPVYRAGRSCGHFGSYDKLVKQQFIPKPKAED